MAVERIQKLLASAGYGSRRECEQLVSDGHVRVNGRILTELPIMVDPDTDRILVNGKPMRRPRMVYLIMNKPAGVLASMSSNDGRRTIGDLIRGVPEPIQPVGRTEPECTGLVLLTNDRHLAAHLTDPRTGPEKVYRVELKSEVNRELLSKLRGGVRLAEGRTSPMQASIVHTDRQRTILEIRTHDRLNREIPRVLAKHGLRVRRMTRIKMGRLSVQHVPLGHVRPLTQIELNGLLKEGGSAPADVMSDVLDTPRARRLRAQVTMNPPRNRRKQPARSEFDTQGTPADRRGRSQREAAKPAGKSGRGRPPRETSSDKPAARAAAAHRDKRRRVILPDE